MDIPTASPDTFSPVIRVLTKATLLAIGVTLSNVQLGRMEKRGDFPRRFYLSPKCPVWDATEVGAWIDKRRATATESTSTAKATAANARRRQAKETRSPVMAK